MIRVHSVVGSALLVLGLAAAAGCDRSSPVSPTASSASAVQTAISTSNRSSGQSAMRPDGGPVVTVSLQGQFAVGNGAADNLSGTYTGTAASSAGTPEQASLTLQITAGTGVYAGASGTVNASGTGAFSGEGTYTLAARGDAVLPGGKQAQITINLSGTSAASCPADNFTITQSGSGTMSRGGRVTSTFSHTVTGGASCIS